MRHGFRLAYTSDQPHGKLCAEHSQGVLYCDRLEEVASKIEENWTRGSVRREEGAETAQYFDLKCNFAEIRRRYDGKKIGHSGERICHVGITIVSHAVIALEGILSDLKLPFDLSNVRDDGGC
jgi:hypothetical protein